MRRRRVELESAREAEAKHAVRLSGLVKFEEAERLLCDLSAIGMSDTSVWWRVQKWGQPAQASDTAH